MDDRNKHVAEPFRSLLNAHADLTKKVDPRDPDYSRKGIFVYHNCYRCKDGALPCVQGGPHKCEYPHARDD